MPLPPFPNLDDIDDSAKRSQFVGWVLEALQHLVEDQDYIERFADGLHGDMQAAWNEARPAFAEFPRAAGALPADRILNHGLAGAQLDFKLATVRYWANRFQGNVAGFVFRRLLDSIDTLLDSLLAAMGVGSSLTELKDAIRNSVSCD